MRCSGVIYGPYAGDDGVIPPARLTSWQAEHTGMNLSENLNGVPASEAS